MPQENPPRLFCFGLGYSARALADGLQGEGWRIAGTNRRPENASSGGRELFAFDGTTPLQDAHAALAGTTHLLSSVPPGADGDPVLAWHAADIAAISGLRWIGYLSTTGVYGDRQGGWVDEDSPRQPTGSRGERRVAAEDGWFALGARCGVPVQSFRLAGIYGPGRNALETVRSGNARRVVKPGQVFSRIHVDDIAAVLRASIARPHAGAAYNVCDNEAAPPETVIEYACALLGVEPPPPVAFEDAELSPMGRSFYRDNKRVSNRRIREELGVTLNWPDYREGLRALLADC
ncbi:MAG: SDR family oxidoreductase [Proteobacteria bacterium]|nr:SDR family oxidoreductase [Pseudomonadota bacterium]